MPWSVVGRGVVKRIEGIFRNISHCGVVVSSCASLLAVLCFSCNLSGVAGTGVHHVGVFFVVDAVACCQILIDRRHWRFPRPMRFVVCAPVIIRCPSFSLPIKRCLSVNIPTSSHFR